MVDKPTPSEIIESCLKTIELNPNDARTCNNLGVAYSFQKKYNEAIEYLQKAVEIDPKYAKAYQKLASVYFLIGFRDDAVSMLEKAIEIDPGLGSAYIERSKICFYEKQYSNAIDYYEKAAENGLSDIPKYREAIELNVGRADQPDKWIEGIRTLIETGEDNEKVKQNHPELVVVFACPPVLDITAENNLKILKKHNPDTPVYVVKNPFEIQEYGWRNADQAFFGWFLQNKPPGKRFALIESDMLCTISLHEFYSNVWDADLVAQNIFRPGEEWFWWQEVGRLEKELRKHSVGAIPLAGMLFSRNAMELLAKPVCDMEDVFCELRLGTLAESMGLRIVEGGWGSITARPLKDHEITEPGLYHMVKHIYSPNL